MAKESELHIKGTWNPELNRQTRIAPKPADNNLQRTNLAWQHAGERVYYTKREKTDTPEIDGMVRIVIEDNNQTSEGPKLLHPTDTPQIDHTERFAYRGSYTEHRQGEDHDEPSQILEFVVNGPDRQSDERYIGSVCGEPQEIVVDRQSEVAAIRQADGTLTAKAIKLTGTVRESVKHISRKMLANLNLPFNTDSGFETAYKKELHRKTTRLHWKTGETYPIRSTFPKKAFGH